MLQSTTVSIPKPATGADCNDPPLEAAGGRKLVACVGLALVASLLYAYWGVIRALVRTWWDVGAYHHGFLIPPIACFLVWNQRSQILQAAAAPRYLAGSFLFFSNLLLLFAGKAAAFLLLEYLALPLMLAGAVLLFFGKQVLRIVALPIGYLTLMLPAWDILLDRARHPSQIISAELATLILHALGIPARREEVRIILPSVVVDVTPDCSGLNYVLALVAVGTPLAVLLVRGRGAKFLLISGTLAIAFLGNGLRIALVGLLAGDSGDAPHHDASGIFVAIGALAVLFVGALVLSRRGPASSRFKAASGEAAGTQGPTVSAFVRTGTFRRLGLLLSLGLALEGVLLDVHRVRAVPLEKELAAFPLELGPWKARASETGVAADFPWNADQSLERVYARDYGPAVSLRVAYLGKQEQGRELVDYRAEATHRAAAPSRLELRGGSALPDGLAPREPIQLEPIAIHSIPLDEYGDRKVRLLWWELDGRSISDPYKAKLFDVYRSVIHGRNCGALVVVETEAGSDEEASSLALEAVEEFVRELLPAIKSFLRPGAPPSS